MQLHWPVLNVSNAIIRPIKTKRTNRIDESSTNTASSAKNILFIKKQNSFTIKKSRGIDESVE